MTMSSSTSHNTWFHKIMYSICLFSQAGCYNQYTVRKTNQCTQHIVYIN